MPRPTPRLFDAIVRLGMPPAAAAFVINQHRHGEHDARTLAYHIIRGALFLRRSPLPIHPAGRPPMFGNLFPVLQERAP